MGIDRIEKNFDVAVKITQYPLHPDTPAEGMTLEQLFAGRAYDFEAAQARLAAMMAELALPYGKRTHTYNSQLAQELAKWGELQPGGRAIHVALFKSFFADGINFSQVDKLVQIAGSIGLSQKEAREVLETRSYEASVDGDWRRASELGVTSVPTFVMNGQRVIGAQTYDILEQLVTQSGAERRQ